MAALSKVLRSSGKECVSFWCPGCDHCHTIPVKPRAGHGWGWNESADKPTFTPSVGVNLPSNSHHVSTADVCHSFVRDGQIEFLNDCTHALAGQTVPIPDWPADYHDGDD